MLLDRIAVDYSGQLRDEKWTLYSHAFPPRSDERVLDVGVSSLDELPHENYFLSRYPYHHQLTGVGITDLEPLRRAYPDATFVQADGRELPFDDLAFDVVHSNAVVEHVGGETEQRRFVHELTRVARAGFVTTPERWFPFDTHTRLPVCHWLPRPLMIRAFEALGRPERGIWLLSRRRFRRLFPPDVQVQVHSQRIAGWPATTVVIFRRS